MNITVKIPPPFFHHRSAIKLALLNCFLKKKKNQKKKTPLRNTPNDFRMLRKSLRYIKEREEKLNLSVKLKLFLFNSSH
jgi:hypothetical protein